MVELQTPQLDAVFHALGDPTRRRMLRELADGERTVGRDLAGFRAYHGGLSVSQRQVPVFSVLIGEGNAAELTIVSKEITGGEFFDARNRDSLAKVFQEIRGYQ